MKKLLFFASAFLFCHALLAMDFKMMDINPPFGIAKGGEIHLDVTYEYTLSERTGIPLEIYHSTDEQLDEGDILMETSRIYSAAGTRELTWQFKVTLPETTKEGDYILVVLDPQNQFSETNEENNQISYQIELLEATTIDLLPLPATPTTMIQNEEYSVNFFIRNNGNVIIHDGFTVRGYLSEDEILDDTDSLLRERVITSSLSQRSDWSIYSRYKASNEPGTYYLITQTELSTDKETNKENNLLVTSVNIVPKDLDITVEQPINENRIASKGIAGDYIASFNNTGSTRKLSSDEMEFTYYLSEDNIFDESDMEMGTKPFDRFNTEYYNINYRFQITIPETWSGSTAYLFVKATFIPSDGVQESNLNNNVSDPLLIKLTEPKPDIFIRNKGSQSYFRTYSYIDNIEEDNNKDFLIQIGNDGNLDYASKVNLLFYHSSDTILDENDQLIINTSFNGLPKESEENFFPALDDLNLPEGKSYVFAVASPVEETEEVSLENNQLWFEYVKSGPKAELSYEYISLDNEASLDGIPSNRITSTNEDSLQASAYIMTYGTESTSIGFYYSEDKIFDPTDTELAYLPDGINTSTYIHLHGVPQGDGYILSIIDPYNLQDEYTRSNNIGIFPLTISVLTTLPSMGLTERIHSYPNPFSDIIYFKETAEFFQIINQYGKVVKSGYQTEQCKVEDLSTGIYHLKMDFGNETFVQKIIKE